MAPITDRQIVGNIGLFHVCYELSRRGFNVVPTSRNMRAVDVIVGNADFGRYKTIQVNATTTNIGINIGPKSKLKNKREALAETSRADFWVYVRLHRNVRIQTESIPGLKLDPKKDYDADHVFVWRGDDARLLRSSPAGWWYEMYLKSEQKKWAPHKNDLGWILIEDALNGVDR